jgi:O-antigen/teichoic acid export membrane protein
VILPTVMSDHKEELPSMTARATWLVCARIFAFTFAVALPLLLVRRLSQHDFGLYKQVFLVIGTAVTLLPIGFGMSAYYFLPRERERQGQIVLNVLLFYTATGGLVCLALWLRPQLLATLFASPELTEYGPAIGLAVLLWVVSSFLETVVVANQEARPTMVIIVATQFSKALLLLVAAISIGSVRALVYAAIVQGVLQTAALLFYLRSRFGHFWRGFESSMIKRQLAYALPLGFAGLIYTMQVDLHNYFVSNRFGPDAFAIYAIGCFQLPLVGILSEAVGSVMIPRVSFLQKQENHREIVELIVRVMRKLSFVFLPLYAFLMVSGREFITVLFTARYLDSLPIFLINLTILPFSILMLDPIQRAYAEQRYFLLKMHSLLMILLMVALLFGTKFFGLVGAISVVVGVNLIGRLIVAIKLGSILGVKRDDARLLKDVGKIAGAALTAGIITALVRLVFLGMKPLFVLVLCAITFTVLFLANVMLLDVLTLEERETTRRWIARSFRNPWRGAPEPLL